MILFKVQSAVITVLRVSHETATGWRCENGGFINRKSLAKKYIDISAQYYTNSCREAIEWRQAISGHMTELIQAGLACESDIDFWTEGGSDEQQLPRSRFVCFTERPE